MIAVTKGYLLPDFLLAICVYITAEISESVCMDSICMSEVMSGQCKDRSVSEIATASVTATVYATTSHSVSVTDTSSHIGIGTWSGVGTGIGMRTGAGATLGAGIEMRRGIGTVTLWVTLTFLTPFLSLQV